MALVKVLKPSVAGAPINLSSLTPGTGATQSSGGAPVTISNLYTSSYAYSSVFYTCPSGKIAKVIVESLDFTVNYKHGIYCPFNLFSVNTILNSSTSYAGSKNFAYNYNAVLSIGNYTESFSNSYSYSFVGGASVTAYDSSLAGMFFVMTNSVNYSKIYTFSYVSSAFIPPHTVPNPENHVQMNFASWAPPRWWIPSTPTSPTLPSNNSFSLINFSEVLYSSHYQGSNASYLNSKQIISTIYSRTYYPNIFWLSSGENIGFSYSHLFSNSASMRYGSASAGVSFSANFVENLSYNLYLRALVIEDDEN